MAANSLDALFVVYNDHRPEKQQHLAGGRSLPVTSRNTTYAHTHTDTNNFAYYDDKLLLVCINGLRVL